MSLPSFSTDATIVFSLFNSFPLRESPRVQVFLNGVYKMLRVILHLISNSDFEHKFTQKNFYGENRQNSTSYGLL